MRPILFEQDETVFDTNGIGALSDAVSCKVEQVLNGKYELTLQYPVKGLHFAQIARRSVILAKVDQDSNLQPFRVYRITKPTRGVVTVYARHIAYDLAGIVVTPFTANVPEEALRRLPENAVPASPFSFETDKSNLGDFSVETPSAIWDLLGSTMLDAFGGEYEFDRWNVKLWNHRGSDRGVSIRYGKNLTSLEQDENCASCYTGVLPFWKERETGTITMLPERVVSAAGTFAYTKVYPLDLSSEFDEKPTSEQLRTKARSYMAEHKICEPAISWKVEFVQLEQTEEYKDIALLERVYIGDDVEVVFEQLNISAKARATAYRYDSLLERFDYITLGSVKTNITDTIVDQKKDLRTKPDKQEMQLAIEALTGAILGARGGSVRFLDNDGDGMRDTLYIADDPSPALAKKVWRFNYEGWAASSNGYNGQFKIGATLENGILADFITAGTLDAFKITVINLIANSIVSGILKSKDGTTYFDLDNGKIVSANKHRSILIEEGLIRFMNSDGISTFDILQGGYGTFLNFQNGDGTHAGGIYTDSNHLNLNTYDVDRSDFASYRLRWKTIDGIKTLIGE